MTALAGTAPTTRQTRPSGSAGPSGTSVASGHPADRSALADLLEVAGLTGRGGAAFSTATKLRSAITHGSDLLVNACDGELGATKDAWVVAHHLDELVRGARLVAGGHLVTWAAHRDSATLARLEAARLDVLTVPRRYVSSEESALVSLAHGGLARPMTTLTPVSTGGVDARGRRLQPTLVLNAETLWRVAQIADRGPDAAAWFRSQGTDAEPGPRLVSVGGAVATPGVVETAAGVSVRDLVAVAGGATGDIAGVAVGGLSGGWLTPDEARLATWSRAGLAPYDIAPGAGVVEVLGTDRCPLAHVSRVLADAAAESAGQCGPCTFGVPAVADDVALLAARRADGATLTRLQHRLGLLPGRGACRFPDGVSSYAASALRAFAPEVDAHLAGHCTLRRS